MADRPATPRQPAPVTRGAGFGLRESLMGYRLVSLCDRALSLLGLCLVFSREVIATGQSNGWLTYEGGRRSVRIGLASRYR